MTGVEYHHLIAWLTLRVRSADVDDCVRRARTLGDKKTQLVRWIRDHCGSLITSANESYIDDLGGGRGFQMALHGAAAYAAGGCERPMSQASRASHPEYSAGGQMSSLLYPSAVPPPPMSAQLPPRLVRSPGRDARPPMFQQGLQPQRYQAHPHQSHNDEHEQQQQHAAYDEERSQRRRYKSYDVEHEQRREQIPDIHHRPWNGRPLPLLEAVQSTPHCPLFAHCCLLTVTCSLLSAACSYNLLVCRLVAYTRLLAPYSLVIAPDCLLL